MSDSPEDPREGGGTVPLSAPSAIVIDDQRELAELLAERLSLDGFDTMVATTAAEALAAFAQQTFDIAFVDLKLPNMSGLAVARELKKLSGGLKIILVTGFAASVDDTDLGGPELDGVLPKPWRPAELEAILSTVGRGKP